MRHTLETTVSTPQAQGDDSHVIVRRLTWGERITVRNDFTKLSEGDKDLYDAALYEFIFDRIVSWNWKDDKGKLLPIPKTVEDIAEYRDEEVVELIGIGTNIIRGNITFTEVDEKN